MTQELEKYISRAKGRVFFYVTGDAGYSGITGDLLSNGFQKIRASDFCLSPDKFADIDSLETHLKKLGQGKAFVVGLGENLALQGERQCKRALMRLKDAALGESCVVLVLRCVARYVEDMVRCDPRLKERHLVYFESDVQSNLPVTLLGAKYADIVSSIGAMHIAKGMKEVLRNLEDGKTQQIIASTELVLSKPLIPVDKIESSFLLLSRFVPSFAQLTMAEEGEESRGAALNEKDGTEDQWFALLTEISRTKGVAHERSGVLDEVFAKHGMLGIHSTEGELFKYISGGDFERWLCFLHLKLHAQDAYLVYVLSITGGFAELKANVWSAIMGIGKTDSRFREFCEGRKKLIKSYPEDEIARFIKENEAAIKEAPWLLSDNTPQERQAIIRLAFETGTISDDLEDIYPALSWYIKDYVFDCGDLASDLTEYFGEYKRQKLLGKIDDAFLETVQKNARERPFLRLETRDNAVREAAQSKDAYLYWIDALGVEYMAYIKELAGRKDLAMSVRITQANLPTITSVNCGFYNDWQGKKYKESKLDEIKHKDAGGFVFDSLHDKGDAPIHLEAELEVIERAINTAARMLKGGECKSFVIAGDHGASRLAVIRRQEEKYECDTKGEHSGRCCKEFAIDDLARDLPFATKENGYYVLGDYGRFRGSRAANVEVHGGSTFEEVIVPVITLTLQKQRSVQVQLIQKGPVIADRKTGAAFTLYISAVQNPKNINVEIEGKRYQAEASKEGANHYSVVLADKVRNEKNVRAEVYDGEVSIGDVTFDIQTKMSSQVDSAFDNLFDSF